MGNIDEALSLLVVGMIMVLLILFLVVVIGNLVVQLTNRYLPEEQKPIGKGGLKSINPKKMAVIAAVVDVVTGGEGRVESVQKK